MTAGRLRPPRWARVRYASRRSGWFLGNRSRRWRALREHQSMTAATGPCWRTTPDGRAMQDVLQAWVATADTMTQADFSLAAPADAAPR